MKSLFLPVKPLWLLLVLSLVGQAVAADPAAPVGGASVAVTPSIIQARLNEVEASGDLDETTRRSLTELYRRALSKLEEQRANQQAAAAFAEARATASAQASAERAELDALKREAPTVVLEVSEQTPLAEVEQLLLNEKANQAAVDAKLAEIEKQLDVEAGRPGAIRQRIIEARQRQELLGNELNRLSPPGELLQLSEARRWGQQAEGMALSAELKMLDQELLSQPMRLELLKVRQERTERSLRRISEKIVLLEELVSRQRRSEAEQARVEAEAARAELAGKHPVIRQLAESNAVLTDRLGKLSVELEEVASNDQMANTRARRIEEELRSTRQKLEVAGVSQVLGQVLLEQRRLLPDVRNIQREGRARENRIAAAALNQIQDNEELRRLRNIDEYVGQLTEGLAEDVQARVAVDLAELAVKRRDLLGKLASLDERYLRALGELEFANTRLIEAVESYDRFLAENLLWVRSAPPPDIGTILAIPEQFYELLAPGHWRDTGRILVGRLTESPVLWLTLLAFAVLLAKSTHMRERITATGKKTLKASTDRYAYTLQALGLTLLRAAPWPLLAGVTGWQLSTSVEATDFAKALGHALTVLAPAFFYLKAVRVMCLPGGLAEAHFRWPENPTKALRRQLRLLMIVFLPAGLVAITTTGIGTLEPGTGLSRVAFLILVAALSNFYYRVLGSRQPLLQDLLRRHPEGALSRFRILWLVLGLLIPVGLVVLALAGFLYTAGVLTRSLVDTLWLVFGVMLIHQLAIRGLFMSRRKLAFEAAIERRRAALDATANADQQKSDLENAESSQHQVEEPDVDLLALNEGSRKLLNTTLPFLALIGLWFIWADVLPAFGFLDDISVWHHKGIIGGEEQLIPVSVADLLLAIIILVITIVASKHFPAVLEIILLQRFPITSGGRYAATTLSRYTIAAVGGLFALSTLGASWSQVQWMAAALGVGIGFGLQEIVANFISGLIILFERPIRVGDVVTIGDTNGVVTRIQIRATTIRTWDRLELLVPNKEFITGRLLNWSLSDQITRIKIPVGLAYGSDVQKAMQLMNEAAVENPSVLDDPAPSIIFEAFGDNTLNLVLRCFVGTQDDRMPTLTALHEVINRKFNEAGVVIAFPQRDVHLDTTRPLEVHISRD